MSEEATALYRAARGVKGARLLTRHAAEILGKLEAGGWRLVRADPSPEGDDRPESVWLYVGEGERGLSVGLHPFEGAKCVEYVPRSHRVGRQTDG